MVDISKRFQFIGRGVYTLAEAGRLTGVPVRTLRRWSRGYQYTYRGIERQSPAIIGTGLEQRGPEQILEFRDIIEARFLSAFRKAGVSWNIIRRTAAIVHHAIQHTHPFATRVFRTDGRRILLELISGDESDHRLVDLLRDQYEWDRIVTAHLIAERVEFSKAEDPLRWWPLGDKRRVVVDPTRSFGAPIVHQEGVQTHLLAKAMGIEGDIELVASWYRVELNAVRDAVDFENGLRAAA